MTIFSQGNFISRNVVGNKTFVKRKAEDTLFKNPLKKIK